MENREIEFTIKANTKPMEASMQKLTDDIADGKKSMSQFARELENMSTIKIDGITNALNSELKVSKAIVKDIEGELQKLNNEKMGWTNPPTELLETIQTAENELEIAKTTANNFSNAIDISKIASGMSDIDGTFSQLINDLQYGIGDMQQFTALIDNASKKELRDITSQLRVGLNQAESELSELQLKLISAVMTDASPQSIEKLQAEIKQATTNVKEFQKALSMLGKTGASQGGILSKIFASLKSKVASVGKGAKNLANSFKRIAISSVVFSALGVIRGGLQDAISLSDTAQNKFTGISNTIAGSLVPIIDMFANAVRKAFVWVAGLINFLSGEKLNIIQKGIDATNKNIQKIGTNAKKSGKQVKDGLLGGMDEITNIETNSGSSGSSGGASTDMSAQLGALGELNSMMTEMNALDFSWAEPLRAIMKFIIDNGKLIATIIGIIVGVIVLYNTVMAICNIVMTPVKAIILAIVAAIVILIAVIVLVIKHWEEIKEVVSKVVSAIWEWICNLVKAIGQWFADLWDKIVAIFTPVVDFFVGIFKGAWEGIKAIWNGVVAFFKAIWNGIVAVFNGVINFYRTIFTTAWNVIKTVWGVVVNWFKGIWDGIKNVFSAVGNWFKNVFKSAYDGIVNVFSKITGFFKGIWDSIKAIFSKVGQVIGNAITNTVKKAVNTVLSTAVKIINGFISAINTAISVINAIPGVNIKKLNKLVVPSFDVGTPYVPEDMLAMVHKGERITPAKYNNDDFYNKGTDMSETNDLLNTLIEAVRSQRLVIGEDEIGRASVNYINSETRRRGESII